MRYCSQTCRSADFDWFHWAECGLVERFLQDESIGRLALLVYRCMVKSGLETCLDTYEADPAITEKNSIYDSNDYAAAFLQVGIQRYHQNVVKPTRQFLTSRETFVFFYFHSGMDHSEIIFMFCYSVTDDFETCIETILAMCKGT